jgi:hypothetical protein
LQGGEFFKPETFEMEPSAEEVYAMLPHFWHALPVDKKKVMVAVAVQHMITSVVLLVSGKSTWTASSP